MSVIVLPETNRSFPSCFPICVHFLSCSYSLAQTDLSLTSSSRTEGDSPASPTAQLAIAASVRTPWCSCTFLTAAPQEVQEGLSIFRLPRGFHHK